MFSPLPSIRSLALLSILSLLSHYILLLSCDVRVGLTVFFLSSDQAQGSIGGTKLEPSSPQSHDHDSTSTRIDKWLVGGSSGSMSRREMVFFWPYVNDESTTAAPHHFIGIRYPVWLVPR